MHDAEKFKNVFATISMHTYSFYVNDAKLFFSTTSFTNLEHLKNITFLYEYILFSIGFRDKFFSFWWFIASSRFLKETKWKNMIFLHMWNIPTFVKINFLLFANVACRKNRHWSWHKHFSMRMIRLFCEIFAPFQMCLWFSAAG